MSVVEQLPDLPGKIQGVKSTDPFIVQCPVCDKCYSGNAAIAARLVPFNEYANQTGRRCLDCWADLGWYRGSYESVRGDDPVKAHAMLDRDYPTRNNDALYPEEALELIAGDPA